VSPEDAVRKLHSIIGALQDLAGGVEHNGDLLDVCGPVIDDCISDLEEIRDAG
jgi:hypothetical protein